jgi:CRP-like cAMP-binding protein
MTKIKSSIFLESANYQPLKKYLNSLAKLSEQEWAAFEAMLSLKSFKRKEIFQPPDKICNTVGFILKGCFRSVKDQDGEERTFSFAIEHEFITNYYSVLTQKPSAVSIVAVEPSLVISIPATEMMALFDSSIAWQKIGRRLAEQSVCFYSERLLSSFYETPQSRYDHLMATAPELFLRIPHHMLANYLGMTKETLSRLRNPIK